MPYRKKWSPEVIHSLRSTLAVVQLLNQQPRLSVNEIHDFVLECGFPMTRRATANLLRHLTDNGILMRIKVAHPDKPTWYHLYESNYEVLENDH